MSTIPPPGRRLNFNVWTRLLTAELRRFLPDVAASSTRGGHRVTWRYRDLEVMATNDRGEFKIMLDPRFGGLSDAERHDEFTAKNFARTLAGHFDPKFSVADASP
jgi:hypothetical protein